MYKELLQEKPIIMVFSCASNNEYHVIKTFLNQINKVPTYILDNNSIIENSCFNGCKVLHPNKIKEYDLNKIAIIVPSEHFSDIDLQLKQYGLIQNYHYFNIITLLNDLKPYENYVHNNLYSPWNKDYEFSTIIDYIKSQKATLVDKIRCYELKSLLEQTLKLKGNILEVGVWRGGTGLLLSYYAQKAKKKVYLADTFRGVVKSNINYDLHYTDGKHSDTNVEIVKKLFESCYLRNYYLLEGIFPDETASAIENETFCFCHIDVDVYLSAKETTEWIWNKLSVGGIIVYDDYGFFGCNGVTDYVNEIKSYDDRVFVYNANGHAILIKMR